MIKRPDISLEGERWKSPEGFPQYLVSDFGRVWSLKTHRLIAMRKSNFGFYNGRMTFSVRPYFSVRFYGVGGVKHFKVHRLVAALFCENDDPENKTVVDHIDNDPFNNMARNLRWVTPFFNMQAAKNDETQGYTRWLMKHLETRKMERGFAK